MVYQSLIGMEHKSAKRLRLMAKCIVSIPYRYGTQIGETIEIDGEVYCINPL